METNSYKGYIFLLRATMLLFIEENVDFGLIGAYILFVLEADWDRKHLNYGHILKNDYELAQKWRCNPSTIWRRKRQLIKKGLIQVDKKGRARILNIECFQQPFVKRLAKVSFATRQNYIVISQDIIAEIKADFAPLQTNPSQNSLQNFNVSSKDDLTLSEEHIDIDEVDADIEKERREGVLKKE